MNLRSKLIAIVGSALLLASSITAGSAADINTSVKITGGNLTVSITTGNFAEKVYNLEEQTSTGTFTVSVDDLRGSAVGWNVTLSASAFSPTATEPVSPNAIAIPIANLGLDAGTPGPRTGVVQPRAVNDTTTGYDIAAVSGTGQEIWDATNSNGDGKFDLPITGTLLIPAGTLIGTYQSTVTVSVASGPGN